MSKTAFSKKCEILGKVWFKHVIVKKDQDSMTQEWKDFFMQGAVSLPLAYVVSENYAVIEDASEYHIEDMWNIFCNLLNVDPSHSYSSLDKILDKSSNAPG